MTKKTRHQYHVRLNDRDARRAEYLAEMYEADNFNQLIRHLLRKETINVQLFDEPNPALPLADKS